MPGSKSNMQETPAWYAQRTLREVEDIILAPGSLLELETRLIDGRIQRVYKRLPPSMRLFWMWAVSQHGHATYVVFEDQRVSYAEAFGRSVRAAGVYRHVYGVQKGDRVAICSRNYPDYLVAFWACHLIGAVAVLVNAWLPLEALHYCLTHTQCKLIIVDPERADRLESTMHEIIAEAKSTGVLVLNPHEGKGRWTSMESWDAVLAAYTGDTKGIATGVGEVEIVPEDNATILFTSGAFVTFEASSRIYTSFEQGLRDCRRVCSARRGCTSLMFTTPWCQAAEPPCVAVIISFLC